MNGRVVFFPLKFKQTEEKLKELELCQEKLRYSRISFLNSIKRESLYMQAVAHNRLRSLIKERLRVISEDAYEEHH